MNYQIRKRRKNGREGARILRSALDYMGRYVTMVGPPPFSSEVRWRSEADVEASRLLSNLKANVEAHEVHAHTMNPGVPFRLSYEDVRWEGDTVLHKTDGRI